MVVGDDVAMGVGNWMGVRVEGAVCGASQALLCVCVWFLVRRGMVGVGGRWRGGGERLFREGHGLPSERHPRNLAGGSLVGFPFPRLFPEVGGSARG